MPSNRPWTEPISHPRWGMLLLAFALVLVGIPAGVDRPDHLAAIEERLAWPLEVAGSLEDLPAPSQDEILRLRTWDPQGLFLRA